MLNAIAFSPLIIGVLCNCVYSIFIANPKRKMKNISIGEIEILFEKILDKLKHEIGENGSIETQTIIYRSIPSNKWNRFEKDEDWFSAVEISQGDLDDDVIELKKLIGNSDRPCTYVDFDRTASLLKEISQIYNPI